MNDADVRARGYQPIGSGEPCPVDGETPVQLLFEDGTETWVGDRAKYAWRYRNIRGWRYADTGDAQRAIAGRDEEIARLTAILNTPEIDDFGRGVQLEAAHQRERWGAQHDAGKAPEDWFWLLGYLGGKALHAVTAGDVAKALHHTVSTAAACANWHLALTGTNNRMRPGIEPPREPGPAEGSLSLTRAALPPERRSIASLCSPKTSHPADRP